MVNAVLESKGDEPLKAKTLELGCKYIEGGGERASYKILGRPENFLKQVS